MMKYKDKNVLAALTPNGWFCKHPDCDKPNYQAMFFMTHHIIGHLRVIHGINRSEYLFRAYEIKKIN